MLAQPKKPILIVRRLRDGSFQFVENQDSAFRIDKLEQALTSRPWAAAAERYKSNTQHIGRMVNARSFGVFVELEPGITGLIGAKGLPLGFGKLGQFMPNERLIVEIQSIFPMKRRMFLTYVGEAPEDLSSDDSQMNLALPIDEADALSAVDEGSSV